jgi:quercetin dioxygenase-like cupin family protein
MTEKVAIFRAIRVAVVSIGLSGPAGAFQGQGMSLAAKMHPKAPRIVRVVPPKAGTYSSQTVMDFRVRFDRPVYVLGKPSLPLEVGTALREGKYISGTGTSTLTFRVCLQPGDKALAGVHLINALLSDGEDVIRGRAGALADVSLPQLGLSRIIVDDPLPREDTCTYVTTINGVIPPLVAASSKSVVVNDHLLETGDGYTRRALVIKTYRAPGTRTPIHQHEFSGTTTLLQGEMTLYMEGHEPVRAVAGQSYFMPPGHNMTGVNTGDQEVVMFDSYVIPPYARHWRPVEPGFVECVPRQ